MSPRRCRLYLITPPQIDDLKAFAALLAEALDAGDVACVQLRLKTPDGQPVADELIIKAGVLLAPVVQSRNMAFLVNDRPDLADRLKADGVHIGQSDARYSEARAIMGDRRIVGVTCHSSRHLAMEAAEVGADYVAFGAFGASQTKAITAHADAEVLNWWQELFEVPCVAIGGIGLEHAETLANAGADFIAVSSAVWRHAGGPAEAVRAFNLAFDAASQVTTLAGD